MPDGEEAMHVGVHAEDVSENTKQQQVPDPSAAQLSETLAAAVAPAAGTAASAVEAARSLEDTGAT